jgi:dihydrofolate reductase
MGKLVVVENVSLDGVMQAPARADEDTRGGFERGGWAAALLADDQEAVQAAMGGQRQSAAMLFGRRTYLDLVGHWLATTEPNPFTPILRDTPKYVASRTLTEPLPHPSSILLAQDVPDSVAQLKEDLDGDIVVLGSGVLVRELAAHGLVDEYVLTTLPVVLGHGTRLFGETYAELDVVRSTVTSKGAVVATLAVRKG